MKLRLTSNFVRISFSLNVSRSIFDIMLNDKLRTFKCFSFLNVLCSTETIAFCDKSKFSINFVLMKLSRFNCRIILPFNMAVIKLGKPSSSMLSILQKDKSIRFNVDD